MNRKNKTELVLGLAQQQPTNYNINNNLVSKPSLTDTSWAMLTFCSSRKVPLFHKLQNYVYTKTNKNYIIWRLCFDTDQTIWKQIFNKERKISKNLVNWEAVHVKFMECVLSNASLTHL